MGVLIGPALGGILADAFGRHAPFLVAAGLALVDGLLRLWLIRPVEKAEDDPGTLAGVVRVPGAGAVCGIVALGAALVAITEPVLPLRLADLGWSATSTGLVFGAAVLATAATTPLAGSLTGRHSIARLAGIGGALGAVGLAVVALAPAGWMLVSGMAILGAGAGLVMGAITPAMTVLGAKASPPALGAAFAVFNLAYATGLFVGPTLGGLVTDRAGFSPAMLVLAALILVVAAIMAMRLSRFAALNDPSGGSEAPAPASSPGGVGT
jgi:MFS family permease